MNKNQIEDQNRKTLTEQVGLIVNTLDKYSLKDQYDYILKSLIMLDLVEEVALFSGNCKIERLFPMNRNYEKNCLAERKCMKKKIINFYKFSYLQNYTLN